MFIEFYVQYHFTQFFVYLYFVISKKVCILSLLPYPFELQKWQDKDIESISDLNFFEHFDDIGAFRLFMHSKSVRETAEFIMNILQTWKNCIPLCGVQSSLHDVYAIPCVSLCFSRWVVGPTGWIVDVYTAVTVMWLSLCNFILAINLMFIFNCQVHHHYSCFRPSSSLLALTRIYFLLASSCRGIQFTKVHGSLSQRVLICMTMTS